MVDRSEVERIAGLARIEISEDHMDAFAGQLEKILDMVSSLESLNVDDVPQMMHAAADRDVFRADEPGRCLERERALMNAAEHDGKQIRVPKVV